MAIQTGQGIGAAQNLKGSIGNVDISGITDQILNAAQERRKISAEEKKRGLEDAVKFKKQENALTSGKTPFYSEMGKSVQKSLYDKFMNNEISAVEYEQGLTKAANELSFFEKTIQSSSGKFNGYIYDEETNKFRRGNPVNDFLSSGEGASAYAEQYMNGQYTPAHILETGTTGLNENFYEEPKGDWRKSFYKNKDELTKLAEPSFGVSEFDQNYDVASTIKQVPVLDVVKLVFSDDDAMQSLQFDLIAKEGKTKQEAKAITSDIEETKKYITQKLGLEDQYFKEQISKLNKKSKTGGGFNFNFGSGKGETSLFNLSLSKKEIPSKGESTYMQNVITINPKPNKRDVEGTFTVKGKEVRGIPRKIYTNAGGEKFVEIEYEGLSGVKKASVPYSDVSEQLNTRYELNEESIDSMLNDEGDKKEKKTDDAIYYLLEDGTKVELEDIDRVYGGNIPEGAEKVTEENKDMMEANRPQSAKKKEQGVVNESWSEEKGYKKGSGQEDSIYIYDGQEYSLKELKDKYGEDFDPSEYEGFNKK